MFPSSDLPRPAELKPVLPSVLISLYETFASPSLGSVMSSLTLFSFSCRLSLRHSFFFVLFFSKVVPCSETTQPSFLH